MKQFDSIIFDLDGTLWDVSQACAVAWSKALKKAGFFDHQITAADIQKVSGLPFEQCVSSLLSGLSTQAIETLATEIDSAERDELTVAGGHLYDGVAAGVQQLASKYRLFIVSNCQSWYLQLFLDRYELRPWFVAARCNGDTGVGKSDMIASLCNEYDLSHPIYIGDTMGDQTATLQAGVNFGFVTYGFGTSNNSHREFNSFTDLIEWFRCGQTE